MRFLKIDVKEYYPSGRHSSIEESIYTVTGDRLLSDVTISCLYNQYVGSVQRQKIYRVVRGAGIGQPFAVTISSANLFLLMESWLLK